MGWNIEIIALKQKPNIDKLRSQGWLTFWHLYHSKELGVWCLEGQRKDEEKITFFEPLEIVSGTLVMYWVKMVFWLIWGAVKYILLKFFVFGGKPKLPRGFKGLISHVQNDVSVDDNALRIIAKLKRFRYENNIDVPFKSEGLSVAMMLSQALKQSVFFGAGDDDELDCGIICEHGKIQVGRWSIDNNRVMVMGPKSRLKIANSSQSEAYTVFSEIITKYLTLNKPWPTNLDMAENFRSKFVHIASSATDN